MTSLFPASAKYGIQKKNINAKEIIPVFVKFLMGSSLNLPFFSLHSNSKARTMPVVLNVISY
jgi:hypothetical protein